MISIIADDITGAAELAGIALRYGLKVRLITDIGEIQTTNGDTQLLVCATNTRSMSRSEAINETDLWVTRLNKSGHKVRFKKCDSVLRGHITAELEATLKALPARRALLIPQNPSRGRVISKGRYYINGIPLDETLFARDPEFPCKSAYIHELLGEKVHIVSSPEEIDGLGLFLANAETFAQIETFAKLAEGEDIILAGGADLFEACLRQWSYKVQEQQEFMRLQGKPVLIVCGSTASNPISQYTYIKEQALTIHAMPDEVFFGKEAKEWFGQLEQSYRKEKGLILTISRPSTGGVDFAHRLMRTMTEAVAKLVETQLPNELVIEGGSTAFSILKELRWNSFLISNEISPGVVRMQIESKSKKNVYITLKPGSYSWGSIFDKG